MDIFLLLITHPKSPVHLFSRESRRFLNLARNKTRVSREETRLVRNESSSVGYATPRYKGTTRDLNHKIIQKEKFPVI